jgi:hypothetical protein
VARLWVFTNWFIYATGTVETIGKIMIDYSELQLSIKKLSDQTFSYLNAKNVTEAQKTVEKLEMSTMMLKKYIDWVIQNK